MKIIQTNNNKHSNLYKQSRVLFGTYAWKEGKINQSRNVSTSTELSEISETNAYSH